MHDVSTHDLRKYVSWCFAAECLLNLAISLRRILFIIHRHDSLLPPRNLLDAASFSVLAVIFGLAWWVVWKEKPSERVWGIAASLTYILIFLRSIIFPPRSIWGHVGALVVGTTGMVAFLRHDEHHDPNNNPIEAADSR